MNITTEVKTNGRKSTRQLLTKIPNCNCLYRHDNGTYYAIKKHGGKQRTHSLDTTDREVANRRLKDWIASLDRVDVETEKTTLKELLEKFVNVRAGCSESTRDTEEWLINSFKADWQHGLDVRVSKIKPSWLSEWLAKKEPGIAATTFNRCGLFLKQLFDVAVTDKMIANSPLEGVKAWKRPEKPRRLVPSDQEFEAILKNIREQQFNADAEDSADFIEFMGRAGLGQAEASSLTLGDIDWTKNEMWIRRHKTKELFSVPLYNGLKTFLQRMAGKFEGMPRETRIFKMRDARKSLTNACKRLKLPPFTQRSIRAYRIRRLWQAGIDIKLIAQWQGHRDGGKLILNTYTEVFGSNDKEYIESQLAKLKE
jgi:integrase